MPNSAPAHTPSSPYCELELSHGKFERYFRGTVGAPGGSVLVNGDDGGAGKLPVLTIGAGGGGGGRGVNVPSVSNTSAIGGSIGPNTSPSDSAARGNRPVLRRVAGAGRVGGSFDLRGGA